MLIPEYQILERLQAFDPDTVLKAFEIFKKSRADEDGVYIGELLSKGFIPLSKQPQEGVSFHYLFGSYWVLSEKARENEINRLQKKRRDHAKSIKTGYKAKLVDKKQSMDLSKVDLKCPKCGGKLYKQKVCPGCHEGRNGYRIRLICEENPDHEILL